MLAIDKPEPSPIITLLEAIYGHMVRGHMVRGTQINNQIQRGTRSGGMDCSVGIRCSEGRARSTSKSGQESRVPRWADDCIVE